MATGPPPAAWPGFLDHRSTFQAEQKTLDVVGHRPATNRGSVPLTMESTFRQRQRHEAPGLYVGRDRPVCQRSNSETAFDHFDDGLSELHMRQRPWRNACRI